MAIDYREKEQQFLTSLKPDTGRSLEEWMAAIDGQGLTHRNEVIDWLRRQGFMFSKASWLERIHNNGGRPIYSSKSAERPARRAPARPHPPAPRPQTEIVATKAIPSPSPSPSPFGVAVLPAPAPPDRSTVPSPSLAATPPAPGADAASLGDVLAKAKAMRPLAQYILAEVSKVVPGVLTRPGLSHVALILDGRDFAALHISPRELRLGLALGSSVAPAEFTTARFPGPAPGIAATITHMIVLNDARQVNAALLARVKEAAGIA